MGKMKHNGVTPKQFAYSAVVLEIENIFYNNTHGIDELPDAFRRRVRKHLAILRERLLIAAYLESHTHLPTELEKEQKRLDHRKD